ncbi:CPBP family intramembrane metalloprotease [Lachnospiraceae bacterium MD1]|uniref:CPBP family intramembrane metalloprotease n=1 Tax=Variimorphobacter saccharofermentans TaxID=2755051 RepID=A0A839K3L5_9FIRM|nr:CPBP family intramembrane glutamic endopeptidase [Variimorphobacter saccharofermentans]MBB2183271.1 CPBP family intramembrane metalloprotease [Variimorphobacter saccharofermentans]
MKEMDLKKAMLFFGIPGLSIFAMFNWAYEVLIKMNISIHWSAYLCLWGPILVMVGYIFIRYFTSEHSFKKYFMIGRLSKKQILIVIGAFIVVQVLESLLSFSRPFLASLPGFHVPSYYPDLFRTDMDLKVPLDTFLGIKMNRNVFPIFFWLLWLVTNIGCEELLWRGYALPRMEKYFGKWAWLVNGLLWNICIHLFMRWSFITLIPVTLIVPYLCQRYKSIWPGVIIHGLGNLLVYAILIPSILY